VLHERQSRFSRVKRTRDRKAIATALAIRRQLAKLPNQLRRTISFDNGTEFAEHHRLHRTINVETFFCDPHSPWQKGGVDGGGFEVQAFSRSVVAGDLPLVDARLHRARLSSGA